MPELLAVETTTLVRYAVDATTLGSVYALVALSLALIFGMMSMINFAQGALIVASAYALYVFLQFLPWPLAVLAMLAISAVLSVALDRLAFRPVRTASPNTLLVTSFALAYALQNAIVMIFGARAKAVTGLPGFMSESFSIGAVDIPKLDVMTVGMTVVAVTGLGMFLTRTPTGLQMLAAARDFEMARLTGVRANRVIAVAFALSGLLTGAAALTIAAQTGSITPGIGVDPLVVAFAAVIIGGMGSLTGAALGGFGLGVVTTVLQVALPVSARSFREAFVFSIVILFLLIRPQGLIPGRATAERV